MEFYNIILGRNTQPKEESEKKIKKETDYFVKTLKKKKNKLRIVEKLDTKSIPKANPNIPIINNNEQEGIIK